MRPVRLAPALGLALALAVVAVADDAPPPGVATPPPAEEFLVVPIRLHVLRCEELPEVDCRLSDADLGRILGKVNTIWHAAGIHFGLESIVREPAASAAAFREVRDAHRGRVPLETFAVLRPEATRPLDGLHVYYLHDLPVNGVFLGTDYALVRETARLAEVEGGIDEPVPRVTAHELGHALGLAHRQDRTNLLASGTTGTSLSPREAARARRVAARRPGVLRADRLGAEAEAAEAAGQPDRARRLRAWRAELPAGDEPPARDPDLDPEPTAPPGVEDSPRDDVTTLSKAASAAIGWSGCRARARWNGPAPA